MSVASLFTDWHLRPPGRWTVERYRSFGRAANEGGEALLAFDVSREGLEQWAGDKELRQTMALALARMGVTRWLTRVRRLFLLSNGLQSIALCSLLSH